MTPRTMTIIIAITLVLLIVSVYYFSVPPRGEHIGPTVADTVAHVIDTPAVDTARH